jgi:hypothetical protein
MTLAVVASSTYLPGSFAGGPHREEHRYRTTYRNYDAGFHGYYKLYNGGYYEERHEDCGEVYNGGWYSTTCFDVQPDEYVYVREQVIGDGRTRVTVYRNENDVDLKKDPFVEYDVEREVVIRRHYWSNGYYHTDYVTERYTTEEWAINWESGWGKIFGGFEVGALGAEVLADSGKNDTASQVVGIGLLASASASSISGAVQLHKETELQKAIAAQEKAATAAGTDVK